MSNGMYVRTLTITPDRALVRNVTLILNGLRVLSRASIQATWPATWGVAYETKVFGFAVKLNREWHTIEVPLRVFVFPSFYVETMFSPGKGIRRSSET
jgi:hypothetical protein